MNVYVIRIIKSIGFFCLKLALVIFWIYSVVTNICTYAVNIIDDYSNYLYIRGFETYGEETVATFNEKDNVYIYMVDEVEYSIERNGLSVESIDKSIDIYYDILEPEKNILSEELVNADSFYSDVFKGVSNVYMMCAISVLCLGFGFFVLDKVKYNKLIWKQFV